MIKLRLFVVVPVVKDFEIILEYLAGTSITSQSPCKREAGNQSERLEDATLLALKMEGTTSQGMQAESKNWKRPGNGFFPRASRRSTALPKPRF